MTASGHRLPKEAATLVRSMPKGRAPVVTGCEFSPRLGIPSVHIDNATAAADAMDHLYRLGHRRIGLITGPLVSPLSRDRLKGATARATVARAERAMVVMTGDFSIESGTDAAERLLGVGFDDIRYALAREPDTRVRHAAAHARRAIEYCAATARTLTTSSHGVRRHSLRRGRRSNGWGR